MDLSQVPLEELMALRQRMAPPPAEGAPAPSPAAPAPDLSTMSLDELVALRDRMSSPPGTQPPGVAEDMAKGAATGVAQGLIGAAGMGSDISAIGRSGLGWLADQTAGRVVNRVRTGEWNPTTAAREAMSAVNGMYAPTTSQGITQNVERLIGPMYEPQTVPGQYARTIGRNVPAAAVGPGGIAARAASAIVPGIAEETAGQMTSGTAAEPYARAAAGITAGLGTVAATRAMEQAGVRGQVSRLAPTREQLQQASEAAYDAADRAGVRYAAPGVHQLVGDTASTLAREGIDASLNPGATRAMQRLAAAPSEPTLREMENLRRVANNAAGTNVTNRSDMMFAGKIRDSIDDFMTRAGPQDVVAGDPQAAARALQEARGSYSAMRRSELIDRALERGTMNAEAANSGMNADNAIRQQLKSLLQNEKAMRGFSADERSAIRSVVRGEGVNNALRTVGNLGGGGGGLGAMLTAGVGGAAGGVAAGPAGVLAGLLTPAVAGGMKAVANRNTTNATEQLAALVRARSPVAPPELQALMNSNPQQRINNDALVRALLTAREFQQQPSN